MSKSTLGEKREVTLIGLSHILLPRPSPRSAGGILQRMFPSENATNIFRPLYNRRLRNLEK